MGFNPQHQWSLESELCKMTSSLSIRRALIDLGVVGQDDAFILRMDNNWTRGGDETYIYRFWICFHSGIDVGYILKACASFSPGLSLDNILEEWVTRRNLLDKNGASTPTLVTYGDGIIVEELIPYELKSLLIDVPSPSIELLQELASLTGILSRLGFEPISVFDDLRSRGHDAVIVDFGQDLGPARVSKLPLYHLLIEKFQEWGLILSDGILDNLYTHYLMSSYTKTGNKKSDRQA